MKDKVAFVVIRYGQNMNGGAEQHCRMLAERLVTHYDVEILTTCVKDYVKGTMSYRKEKNGLMIFLSVVFR